MASPSIATTGSSSQTADSTSHTMAMPASISAGDLLLAIFTHDGTDPGISGWPAGWTLFPHLGQATGSLGIELAYRYADGSETDFTLTTSASEESNSRCYRITGHAGPTRPPLCRDQLTTGAGAVYPSVTPNEWVQPQDVLAIIAVSWENTTPTPTPSGYSLEFNNDTGGSGRSGIRCMTQAISSFSGTEDPADATTGSGGRAVYTILIPSDASDPDLTFPIVRNWYGYKGGSATTVDVPLSPQYEAGDILMVAIGLLTNVTISSGLPSGWTTEVSVVGGGAGGERLYVLWKRADGTETDFTLTMSATSAYDLLTFAILNVDSDATIVSGTAVSVGTSSTPDPPNLSATADLWAAVEETETRSVTSFPTSYTHTQAQANSQGHVSGGASIGVAFRQLAATSENPGTFTMSGASFWAAATLAFGKANPRYFQAQWVT